MAGGIFISYRRDEGSGVAGRVYDRLADVYSPDRLFLDVDNLAPGEDFVTVLSERINTCDILLALIGPSWLELTDRTGRRRLDNPDDFVRVEIETALQAGKMVVPVLIDRAEMPERDALPESLRPLLRRHAVRLSHESFNGDVDRLLKTLAGVLPPRPPPKPDKPPARRWPRFDLRMLLTAAILLAIVGLIYAANLVAYSPRDQAQEALAMLDTWQKPEYQAAQAAIKERLARLNEKFGSMLPANPSDAELDLYYAQIGKEAMRESGGDMPLDEFRKHFDLVVSFLNRAVTCVDTGVCSKDIMEAYFKDYASSFFRYFREYAQKPRD